MIIPASIIIGWYWYQESLSYNMLLYVAPIILGSYITAETDISVNYAGVLFSLACVLTSAVSQKWIQVKQKKLKIDSFDLLIYIIPASIGVQILTLPIFDNINLEKPLDISGSSETIVCDHRGKH